MSVKIAGLMTMEIDTQKTTCGGWDCVKPYASALLARGTIVPIAAVNQHR